GATRAQRVQADAGHHRGEPGIEIGDVVGLLSTAQSQPGFLHCVLRVVDRTQHPVRQGAQLWPGGLETRRQCGPGVRGGHAPPRASGRAQTWLPEKPDDPMSSAMLNRAPRLPSVRTWVSPTSCAVVKWARSASNSSSLTSTGVRLIAVA